MQCIYCQNHQISRNSSPLPPRSQTLDRVIEEITMILDQGIASVGFVSPSHMVPQMIQIIKELHRQNLFPKIIFNSNGYDSIDTLQTIAPLIDVYLVDFKYSDSKLAEKLSSAEDYPQRALAAILEMVNQKGIDLDLDDTGMAIKGIIIRHLILPGYVANSIEVLRRVAADISNKIHISLMAQYHPTPFTQNHEHLKRTIRQDEYDRVKKEVLALGFENGWIQELDSANVYRPDFDKTHPFE
jgi:putative pyruvate formate lyase activating enzyme